MVMRRHNMHLFYVVFGVERCAESAEWHFKLIFYYIQVHLLDQYTYWIEMHGEAVKATQVTSTWTIVLYNNPNTSSLSLKKRSTTYWYSLFLVSEVWCLWYSWIIVGNMSSSTSEVPAPLFGRLQCPQQTQRLLKLDASYWTNQPGTTAYRNSTCAQYVPHSKNSTPINILVSRLSNP
jgi:hypothetical protein